MSAPPSPAEEFPSAGAAPKPGAAAGPWRRLSTATTLYGPLLLALYFVATSRWGAFVLPGPPYVADLALGALIAQRLWTLLRHRTPAPLVSRSIGIAAVLLLVFSALTLLRGEWSVDAARDGAPYFYAVLVLFGQSYRRIPAARITQLVFGALIFHAAWVSLAIADPTLVNISMPGDAATSLFELRSDIDGMFVGVLVALAVDRTVAGRLPQLGIVLAGWGMVLVMLDESRASMLATLCLLGLVAVRHLLLRRRGVAPSAPSAGEPHVPIWRYPALAVAVVALVPAFMVAVSGVPPAIERSVVVATASDNFGAGGEEGAEQPEPEEEASEPADGVGTANARTAAWGKVISWVTEDGISRPLVGGGFGPHYMHLSGADLAFQGEYYDPTVRAVHSYPLNTWARLGVVGVVIVAALSLLALIAAFSLISRATQLSDLDLFAALLVVGVLVVAALGVVLESPFGAIPFFWAVGYLSARMVEEGRWRALVDRLPGLRG